MYCINFFTNYLYCFTFCWVWGFLVGGFWLVDNNHFPHPTPASVFSQ